VLLAIFTIACLPSAAAAAGPGAVFKSVGGDFSAFYCSGAAVDEHHNPYLVEPLRSCEQRVQASVGHVGGVVDPSPLPGYDLALFRVLAHLPYNLAKIVWYLSLLGSIGVATFCVCRLTGFPALFVALVLLPVDGILNLSFGQLPPLVVAALCLAAYLVERKRYVAAAISVAATMIEPHIGAPACLAMFIFFPACRIAFVAIAVVLTGIAFATGGIAQNLAYFTTHLPAQARGELVAADQFSLSAGLHLLRLPDGLALALGTFSYLVMAAVGIVLGRRAALRLRSEAFIVVVPAAAVLFAGTYVHDVQFAAALPAAILFCAREKTRILPWICLGLLLMPWFTYGTAGYTIGIAVRVLAALAIGWLAVLASDGRTAQTRQIAVGAGVSAYIALLVMFTILPHGVARNASPISAAFLASDASAQENWGAYLRATPGLNTTTMREEAEKIPFWLAIIGILISAGRGLRLHSYGRTRASPIT
jgi:hypothetical protein